MIVDRTLQDVENTKVIREKLGNGEQITAEDVAVLERGTLTINTLNRIENKQSELVLLLADEGYRNIDIQTRQWSYTDYFNINDLNRIISNLDVLQNNYYTYGNTPATPFPIYHYQNINDIEKNLVDIESILDDMKTRYRRCGTFNCKEVV